jgi:hypothetical protein
MRRVGPLRRTIPTGYLVYEVTLAGLTPLLMSSGEVDRDSDTYLAFEQLAAARKKTREQKAQLRELEWNVRLYHDEKLGPYIPGKNVKELLREAATKFRQGENVRRSLVIPEYRIPLQYEGPRDAKGLWKAGFRYTAMVSNAGAGSGRVDRTRPCFDQWTLVFEAAFDSEEIDKEMFESIVARTVKYGLGDYRPEFGSFEVAAKFVRVANDELRVDGTKQRDKKAEAANKVRTAQVMQVK